MELPEVKQCAIAGSHLFGAVAIKAGENRWGVMHPANGGHWATDGEVDGWAAVRGA
ncbi:hypothetical protein [Mycobacteroides immunogenum]|jgi:hypothetical protein|uniref:hypothetical protein n=1 Tax=Mycobacteroides immunogenum TaxID=83262 RepID=UPI000ACC4498|nr:hypothetical protein [Mycobacteroides immunogenum]MCV7308825.1 hypothetical protein [Mycobacteroides immunogenum]